jgi:hypothetical protein
LRRPRYVFTETKRAINASSLWSPALIIPAV